MVIEWMKDHEFGIERIDTQHRRLADLINSLADAYAKKNPEKNIQEIFRNLKEYAHYHFTFEEMIMQRCGFAEISKHREFHGACLNKIRNFQAEYSISRSRDFTGTVEYLKNWFWEETQSEDKKYIEMILREEIA